MDAQEDRIIWALEVARDKALETFRALVGSEVELEEFELSCNWQLLDFEEHETTKKG